MRNWGTEFLSNLPKDINMKGLSQFGFSIFASDAIMNH